MKKILCVRLDKIGDLVSTLPVDQLPEARDSQITWAVAQGLGALVEASRPTRRFFELDKSRPQEARSRLRKFLQAERPDLMVSFQAPWWVSFEAWRAGVPLRAGVRSQWHSFLFLNRGLRQRRSLAEQHEADYNRDLLLFALGQVDRSNATPVLTLQASVSSSPIPPGSYVVHAGMAGSALNWPMKFYVSLVKSLRAKGYSVVLTGTEADRHLIAPLEEAFRADPGVENRIGRSSLPELLSLLAQAKAVIAPSTGVAHLAASLGRPVLAFFSPIRVQRARRWAPRGRQVLTLTPQVDCPASHHCLGASCAHFPCLEKISPAQAEGALETLT